MTPHEREQYELLLDKTFDTDFHDDGASKNPMPKRLVELHELAYAAGRRLGLTSVPKPTMVCLAIMAGCFDYAVLVKPAEVPALPKRRPGRPTNKEREERALAEKQLAEVT
jgi:hypothetical protein